MTAAFTQIFELAPASTTPYLAPVPDCEPPFDDSVEGIARTSTTTLPAAPDEPAASFDNATDSWSRDGELGLVAPPGPAVTATARALARGLIEALTCFRQPRQLASVCSTGVYATLTAHRKPTTTPPKLISVRATEPVTGAVEVTVVFRRDVRVAAMAFRMQGAQGRWRVTALEIG